MTSGAGVPTDSQLGIRRYEVISDALVTKDLEPAEGQAHEVPAVAACLQLGWPSSGGGSSACR